MLIFLFRAAFCYHLSIKLKFPHRVHSTSLAIYLPSLFIEAGARETILSSKPHREFAQSMSKGIKILQLLVRRD